MERGVTISGAVFGHNAPPQVAGIWLLRGVGLLACCVGCAGQHGGPALVPTADLAAAPAAATQPVARGRISFEHPLPAALVTPLDDQYSLVLIRRGSELLRVLRDLGLVPAVAIDLSRGVVVGVLAEVGENPDGECPSNIREVRLLSGVAAVESDVRPGVYYPLRGPGYLELIYVPGLRLVQSVRIGPRLFSIEPPTDR